MSPWSFFFTFMTSATVFSHDRPWSLIRVGRARCLRFVLVHCRLSGFFDANRTDTFGFYSLPESIQKKILVVTAFGWCLTICHCSRWRVVLVFFSVFFAPHKGVLFDILHGDVLANLERSFYCNSSGYSASILSFYTTHCLFRGSCHQVIWLVGHFYTDTMFSVYCCCSRLADIICCCAAD